MVLLKSLDTSNANGSPPDFGRLVSMVAAFALMLGSAADTPDLCGERDPADTHHEGDQDGEMQCHRVDG